MEVPFGYGFLYFLVQEGGFVICGWVDEADLRTRLLEIKAKSLLPVLYKMAVRIHSDAVLVVSKWFYEEKVGGGFYKPSERLLAFIDGWMSTGRPPDRFLLQLTEGLTPAKPEWCYVCGRRKAVKDHKCKGCQPVNVREERAKLDEKDKTQSERPTYYKSGFVKHPTKAKHHPKHKITRKRFLK